jgi:hypothetical protein
LKPAVSTGIIGIAAGIAFYSEFSSNAVVAAMGIVLALTGFYVLVQSFESISPQLKFSIYLAAGVLLSFGAAAILWDMAFVKTGQQQYMLPLGFGGSLPSYLAGDLAWFLMTVSLVFIFVAGYGLARGRAPR